MRALVPALLTLVACNDPPGLTLEVVPLDPRVEYVEVYLADHCSGCPGAMTPPMMRAHEANMYETDYQQVFAVDHTDAANWKNGHAFFRITSHDANDSYQTYMLVIGFDANRTPVAITRFGGVKIPASGSEYWQAPLDEPVVPLTDAPSTEQRIAIWGHNRTGPNCVLVVNGDGRADGVVPLDDPDCDGIAAAQECAPYAPNAVRAAPNIEHASCVVGVAMPSAGSLGTPLCLLGGPPCTDGGASSLGCDPLDVDYCAPSRACAACVTSPDWDSCVKGKFGSADTATTGIPYVSCSMAMQPSGAECTDSNKRSTDLDLGALLQGGGGTKCRAVRVHDLSLPLGPFVDKVTVGGATFELGAFQDPCKIVVNWYDDFTRGTGVTPLVLDIELDNGKHLVLPLLVRPTDGCDPGTSCMLTGLANTETMLQCTKPTTDSTTCTSAQVCPDSAIACGARCCGRGESCVDGECRCGAGSHCAGDRVCVASVPSMSNPPTGCGDVCCDTGAGTPACPLP